MKVLLLLCLLATPALAEDTAPATTVATPAATVEAAAPPYAAKLRDDTRRVLRDEDFHRHSSNRELAMRDWLKRWLTPNKKTERSAPPLNFSVLAQVIKALLILVLVVALGWLLWRGWQWLAPRLGRTPAPVRGATLEARSFELPHDTLPDAVSSAARAAWQRGDAALALSLLYRGAVRVLEERYGIELPGSATEGECLRLARRSGKAVVTEAFAPIVRAWSALAYARAEPDDFERLAALYVRYFETAANGGQPS